MATSKSSSKSKKLVRNPNTPSLKSQGAGYSTTNRKGVTTFYKSSKDAPGYNDTTQSRSNMSKGTPLSAFDSKGTVINSESLKPNPTIPLAKPTPVDGLFGVTNATNAGLAALNGGTYDTKTNQIVPPTTPTQAPVDNSQAILNSYLQANAGLQAPSAVDNLKEMQKMLKPKEKLTNSLTGQLNTLNASRDAEMLKLEGQGRGQTGGFIGGEQARINREAAIQAMPIQAQLAIAQDDLESARTYAGQYFQAKMQDETNIYNQKKENNQLIFNFLNAAEQRRVAANEKALDREYAEKQATSRSAEAIAMQAIEYGQSSLATKVMALDTKSPTYAQDVRNAMAQLRKPVAAVSTKRDTQVVDGKLIDSQTGEVIAVIGSAVDETTKRQLTEAVSAQESLLNLARDYKNTIDTVGFTNTIGGDPAIIGKIKSQRALMTAEYKKAAALGTLDTGVLTLMDSILGTEPTSTFNPLTNITGRKSAELSSQLDTFITQTEANKTRDEARLGIVPANNQPTVRFDLVLPEDDLEINNAYGINTSTVSNFNAANYFKN